MTEDDWEEYYKLKGLISKKQALKMCDGKNKLEQLAIMAMVNYLNVTGAIKNEQTT